MGKLSEHLTAEKVELLKIIWEPIPLSLSAVYPPGWPVWDYVSRRMHRTFPQLTDAKVVLQSLPTVRVPTRFNQDYGLVWTSHHSSVPPSPDERIGLTVAGLAALAQAGGVNENVPNELAVVIGQLADREDHLEPNPHEVVTSDVPLADYTQWFAQRQRERPYVVPDRVLADVLVHEYAPVGLLNVHDETGHQVQLGRISLRRYLGVASAQDYLIQIDEQDSAFETITYSSPLTLVQTFDYLAYVLAADPSWGPKRLINAPDLQSAAAVSAAVSNRHEYETALSGLCTVIDQLGVPEISKARLDVEFNGQQPPSVNRLQDWLSQRLQGTDGLERAAGAMKVLRAVRENRKEAQHSSVRTRQSAMTSRPQLGIPEAISVWSAAWRTIQNQLAGALDVIRQEVQSAPPTEHRA
ncbi:MAG: hypothetical protein M3Y49_03595 [Actinomycetota bacterium]|nr:hypothetical protein [Actinomycetota bacterium]